MAASAGKLKISYVDDASATQSFELTLPNFGYRTTIKLPFDIQRLDTKKWARYDHGDGTDDRDERRCECDLILTTAEQTALFDAIGDDTKARGRSATIEMGAGSGFHPFGPDKGPTGPFTVDAVFTSQGIGQAPYKMFRVNAVFTALGDWGAYSPPAEVAQGQLTIGTVSGLRFPLSWFRPVSEYAVAGTIKGGTGAEYINRGTGGDGYSTSFQMRCNESKAAALLAYLTGTARTNNFSITTVANSYPFDIDNGTSGTYTVCNISDTIEIEHPRYNEFLFDLQFGLAA